MNISNSILNQRYIKSKVISKAIEEGYQNFLMQHRYPFCVLFFTLPSDEVDVNVHPAKLEVRFEDESRIFQSIYHAIKNTLLENELVANTEKPKELDRQENTEKQESKGLFDFRKNETEKIQD